MNLKSIVFIGLFILNFSSISVAAPMPKACNDLILAGNESIEILKKLKREDTNNAAAAENGIKQVRNQIDTIKNLVEKTPNNQISDISNICEKGFQDTQKMNKKLQEKLY